MFHCDVIQLAKMSTSCQPHATIAARNLLQYPSAISGWLRREGKLERLTSVLIKTLGIKWRQKLVVVVDGCLYIYKNESATSPQHAAPLSDYNVVKRAEQDIMSHVHWCFKLEPLASGKTHYFACTCFKEMLDWIYKFKREMLRAHSKPVISLDEVSESDYVELEEPIFAHVEEPNYNLQTQWSDVTDNSSHRSGSIYSDDYFEIDPNQMDAKTQRPLPDIPSNENTDTKSTNKNGQKHYVNVHVEQGKVKSPPSDHSDAFSTYNDPVVDTMPTEMERPIGTTELPKSKPPKIVKASKPQLPGLKLTHNGPPAVPTQLPGLKHSHNGPPVIPTQLPGLKHTHNGPPPLPTGKPPKSPQSPSSTTLNYVSHMKDDQNDFLFNSADKESAAQYLDKRAIGTFLVRNSRQSPDSKVLAIQTPDGIKEYQIRSQDQQSSLDGKMKFNTLDQLVTFYKTHKLPTQPIMLSKGYSSPNLSTI